MLVGDVIIITHHAVMPQVFGPEPVVFFLGHAIGHQELEHPGRNVESIVQVQREEALFIERLGDADGGRAVGVELF